MVSISRAFMFLDGIVWKDVCVPLVLMLGFAVGFGFGLVLVNRTLAITNLSFVMSAARRARNDVMC